ncbi:unnamed protein product [Rotaria socialis]|uniref:Uncharacterized protein n=2 Tax=Rotaria socialis TaxID=392032 RepID=A0A821K436_9BILA|nr:unnamed protein product [Rotaria socialis]CAF3408548.1 unnamed protein product [Rotaria socialis]CAF4475162.1 unnamed protein product [Rotaria socialis]CAF4733255.1 unnamed protein product [Rotaria socialis]
MHQTSSSPGDMASGHSFKTRAEQERISSFLYENSRRSSSEEKKSRHNQGGSSRQRRHRHPLDPIESDSDSDHRSRHKSSTKSKSKHHRSHSRSSSSGSERRRKRKQTDKNNETSHTRRRRHSSASSSHSSQTRSKSRDRKRRISVEKHEPKTTSTIIMHNIPLTYDEHELLSELMIAKVPLEEIRIIHRRDPATNLQTAYIEFNTVQEAEQWMTLTQGTFLLNDHLVTLTHRFDDDSSTIHNINNNTTNHRDYQRNNTNELRLRDWDCYKCGVQNFKRRDHCFNCHISREDSERTRDLDGFSFVGLNPCNTLVLRGLDILTSKETIETKLLELTLVQMKNSAIVKDNYTGVSRGFAFVEYNTIHDSVLVYEKLQTTTPGVEIEGKAVIVHFSKNNFATSLAQIQDEDEDFYSRRSNSSRSRHRHDHDRSANVAQLLPSNNVDRTNTAAEIAQHALQNIHAQKQRDYTRPQRRRNHSSSDYSSDSSSNHHKKRHCSTKDGRDAEPYSTPDPSKFEWYPDVGFHFDKTTGFYFDAKSSYFYNPTTLKYMYWDPAKLNYIPVEDTVAPAVTTEITNTTTSTEPKDKTDKVKNAQKVAKEMEQWAKKERERKEKETKRKAQVAAVAAAAITTATTTTSNNDTTSMNLSTSAVSASFAEVGLPSNRPTGGLISLNLMSSNSSSSTSTSNRPALLAAFENPESDNDDNDNNNAMKSSTATNATTTTTTSTNILDSSEEKLVDWNKLACLLCQRQFDTREILEKHLQMSNLHKENLAKAGIVRSQPLVYRDRAKERRQAYGPDDSTKQRNDYSPIHERSYSTSSRRMPSQNQSSLTDGIGSKLMKKHGWQEGQGLGKKLQGRSNPVEAEHRQRGLGLGADQRLKYNAEPGDSYKDVVRKVARARFSMMES